MCSINSNFAITFLFLLFNFQETISFAIGTDTLQNIYPTATSAYNVAEENTFFILIHRAQGVLSIIQPKRSKHNVLYNKLSSKYVFVNSCNMINISRVMLGNRLFLNNLVECSLKTKTKN